MKILVVALVMTSWGPAMQYPVPAGGREVPQNAPAFAGAPSKGVWEELADGGREPRVVHARLARIELDGGVRLLEPIDGGTDWSSQFFSPGALKEGETFFLERDGGGVVRVGPAAPLPKDAGTLVFGPLHIHRWPFRSGHRVARDMFIKMSNDARPWLAVARVKLLSHSARVREPVIGMTSHFFGLPVEEPLGARIGEMSVNCEQKPGRNEVAVAVQLEIAGAVVQPAVMSATVVLDCAELVQ